MKPTVPQAEPLIRAYYAIPGNRMGGSLHIVLEDGNINDGHLEFCYEVAMTDGWMAIEDYPGDGWDTGPVDHLGAALALVLLAMSKTQRKKIYRAGY